jgi:hypothetical protein
MNNRTSTLLTVLNGVICGFFFIHLFFFPQTRTVRNDVVQGILIGGGLAFVTTQIYARIKATKVNGWITMFGLGKPGNGMLLRAAHAQIFPGPVNVSQEAMYWTTSGDGAGHRLSGQHDYLIHFPPGGLPPNNAFWSLTMGDAQNRFVANPPHPGQYALYGVPNAFCRSPPRARLGLKIGDYWCEPRHAHDGWLARSLKRTASLARTRDERSLLQRAVH